MTPFWTSWSTTVGLLAAIGAQNAFVIESAILKRHAVWVALTCIISDFIMITGGYLGLSVLIKSHPEVQEWLAWIGIIFLVYYGGNKLHDAFKKEQRLDDLSKQKMTLKTAILKTISFSWLNPHVYVDTVILIPALALQFSGQDRYIAGAAGYFGVVTWFVGVTILGTVSSKLFQNPKSWKILNLVTAIIMFWVALKLYKDLT